MPRKKRIIEAAPRPARNLETEFEFFKNNKLFYDVYILSWIRNPRYIRAQSSDNGHNGNNGNGAHPKAKEAFYKVPHSISSISRHLTVSVVELIHARLAASVGYSGLAENIGLPNIKSKIEESGDLDESIAGSLDRLGEVGLVYITETFFDGKSQQCVQLTPEAHKIAEHFYGETRGTVYGSLSFVLNKENEGKTIADFYNFPELRKDEVDTYRNFSI